MNKRRLITIAVLLLIVIAIIWKVNSCISSIYKPYDVNDDTEYTIDIVEGSGASDVAKILYENKIIRNGTAFKEVLKDMDLEKHIKSGKFTVKRSMTLEEIANIVAGKSENSDNSADETIKVTIPEGFELTRIAQRLEEKGLVSSEDFLNECRNLDKFKDNFNFLTSIDNDSLEGFLFPATYEIKKGSSSEEIVTMMLKAFENIYNKLNADGDIYDLNSLITLASIVEREAKLEEERPIIAKVFLNRIEKNIRLQSCATIQYALGERKANLSNEDLKIDSPFNTYTHNGLPPAPICNPGEASIVASMNPADVDYLYFVVKPGSDGAHNFSSDYNEFLKDKKDYKGKND